MMDTMFGGHCTDEDLVGYSDGELSTDREQAVRDHLASCWQCRLRSKDLEEQALRIARAIEADNFPGPRHIAAALEEFESRRRSFHAVRRHAPKFALLPGSARRTLLPPAALLLPLLLGVGFWFASTNSNPDFHKVVVQVDESTSKLHSSALYQHLRVEVIQTRPVQRRSFSRLEVWSDPAQSRFACEFRGVDGNLKHALRRPRAGEQYVYYRTAGKESLFQPVSQPVSIAELAANGVELERIEAAFLRWLETRRWQPISLASEVALLSTDDRVMLLAERSRSVGGKPAFRLTAQRQDVELTVTITLVVDGKSHLPRLQTVRFESPAQVVELRLISVPIERVETTAWSPAVFRPRMPPGASEVGAALSNPKNVLPELQPAAQPQTPTDEDLEAAEIELRYALHRARADLGEAVTVERRGRRLMIQGVVETQERKQEILAAVSALLRVEYADSNIQTISEAGQTALTQHRELQDEAPVEAAGPVQAADSILVSSARLPVQDRLERYFATRIDTEDGEPAKSQQVVDFSNHAVDLASAMLDEAWALRRLARRYPAGRYKRLKVQTNWLLETMVSDHIRAVANHAAELQRLVEPALLWILGSPEAGEHVLGRRTISVEDGDWDESVEQLFEDAREVHDLALALLAGRQLPAPKNPGRGTLQESSLQPIDQAMIELLAAFRRVEEGLRQLDHDSSRRFAGGENVSAGYPLK